VTNLAAFVYITRSRGLLQRDHRAATSAKAILDTIVQ
jgi:hypothetical protein